MLASDADSAPAAEGSETRRESALEAADAALDEVQKEADAEASPKSIWKSSRSADDAGEPRGQAAGASAASEADDATKDDATKDDAVQDDGDKKAGDDAAPNAATDDPAEPSERDATVAAAPPPPAPAKRGGAPLLTGAIGAVIGAGAMIFLAPLIGGAVSPNYQWVSAPQLSSVETNAAARLTALEQQLEARAAALEAEIAALDARSAEADAAAAADRSALRTEQAASSKASVEARETAAAAELRMLSGADARDQAIADLREGLASLAAVLDETGGVAPDGASRSELAEGMRVRLTQLEGDTARQRDALRGLRSELDDALAKIDARIAELATGPVVAAAAAAPSAKPAAAVQSGDGAVTQIPAAMAQLEMKLAAGSPFEADLEALERDYGLRAPAALYDPSNRGVTPADELSRGFEVAAMAGNRAFVREEQGWAQAMVATLPIGPVEGGDARAVLSRAMPHVASGDLGAALEVMTALPVAARSEPELAAWIRAAEERVAADRAFAALVAEFNAAQ